MTDEEKANLAIARAALGAGEAMLAESLDRSAEVESISAWFKRARAKNNFSARLEYMLQHHGQEPPR